MLRYARAFVAILAVVLGFRGAAAATVSSDIVNGVTFLLVAGELEPGDEVKFVNLALPVSRAIVFFNSPGGVLRVGIEIGNAIRLKGFATAVAEEGSCASACAIAWLGGSPRIMASTARVGFHAAYVKENGQKLPASTGNALVGAYVSKLGLSDRAVEYVTSAPPDGIQWLSIQDAQSVGISVVEFQPRAAGDTPRQPAGGAEPLPSKSPVATVLLKAREAFSQENYSLAAELLTPLADAGDPVASFRLADLLENGSGLPKDMPRAIELVRRAALEGHACAQTHLGDFYESGQLGQKNMAEAVRWWKLGADGGCPWASVHLGLAYRDGNGVARDIPTALRWFERASRAGMWDGNIYLAVAYRRGEIVSKDLERAVYYYRRSAMLNHENSQYWLALMYYNGQGVPRDVREAYIWASIAAIQGEPEPIKFKRKIENNIARGDVVVISQEISMRVKAIEEESNKNRMEIDDWSWKLRY